MTREMLNAMVAEGKLQVHHTASRRGYISRKSEGKVEEYTGKFGTGYVLLTARWDTTNYCYVTYYINR